MARILILGDGAARPADVLPALELLPHEAEALPADAPAARLEAAAPEIVLLDGRRDLVRIRNLALQLRHAGPEVPVLVVIPEAALAALSPDWAVADFLLPGAGPAETEARLRLALAAAPAPAPAESVVRCGAVVVDEASYSATVGRERLNLTFKEFELLKFLVQHPGRVFTRAQLLAEVWGQDYYGGTRTVDVHVRRLRSKLGADHEQLISTVRNVGYRFAPRETA